MRKTMRISLSLLTVIMVVICTVFPAVSVSAAEAEAEGIFLSGDRSAIESKINKLIEENKDSTPSVAITVFDDKKDICSVIYGKSDRENDIAADENTVYEWGSVSKVLVWTSVMQLYEQGKLDLKADIRTYLPDGFLTKLNYDTPVTMLDLMNHSAGFLNPYKEVETDDPDSIMSLEEALRETEPAQRYESGKTTAYSNYGAALAGYVVERVSKISYADYVRQNIFDRLGMKHTSIKPDMSDNEWAATQRKNTHCYVSIDNSLESLGECRRYIHIYPAGGACGTIGDMAVFARAFLSDSKSCPLFDKETTLDEMLSPSMYFSDGKTPRFYHGLMAEKVGLPAIGHGGNTEGFTSLMQFDPKTKTGFVMMINKQQDRIYQSELMKLFYGSADISAYESESFRKYDFSGRYSITGGTLETGCFSLYSFFGDGFEITQQGDTFTGSLGVTQVRQISDNAAVFSLITGSENLVFIRTDENGEFAGFENETFDFIKTKDSDYYSGLIALILMCVGHGLMLILTIIHLIRLRRYRGQDIHSFRLAETLTGAAAAAVTVCIALMLSLDMLDDGVRMTLCISIAVFTVLLLLMNVFTWIKKPRGYINAVLPLETLCSIFIAAGAVYWKLFQFWGC